MDHHRLLERQQVQVQMILMIWHHPVSERWGKNFDDYVRVFIHHLIISANEQDEEGKRREIQLLFLSFFFVFSLSLLPFFLSSVFLC